MILRHKSSEWLETSIESESGMWFAIWFLDLAIRKVWYVAQLWTGHQKSILLAYFRASGKRNCYIRDPWSSIFSVREPCQRLPLYDPHFIWRVVKWFNARHIRVIGGYYSAPFVYLVFLGRTKVTLLVIVEKDSWATNKSLKANTFKKKTSTWNVSQQPNKPNERVLKLKVPDFAAA